MDKLVHSKPHEVLKAIGEEKFTEAYNDIIVLSVFEPVMILMNFDIDFPFHGGDKTLNIILMVLENDTYIEITRILTGFIKIASELGLNYCKINTCDLYLDGKKLMDVDKICEIPKGFSTIIREEFVKIISENNTRRNIPEPRFVSWNSLVKIKKLSSILSDISCTSIKEVLNITENKLMKCHYEIGNTSMLDVPIDISSTEGETDDQNTCVDIQPYNQDLQLIQKMCNIGTCEPQQMTLELALSHLDLQRKLDVLKNELCIINSAAKEKEDHMCELRNKMLILTNEAAVSSYRIENSVHIKDHERALHEHELQVKYMTQSNDDKIKGMEKDHENVVKLLAIKASEFEKLADDQKRVIDTQKIYLQVPANTNGTFGVYLKMLDNKYKKSDARIRIPILYLGNVVGMAKTAYKLLDSKNINLSQIVREIYCGLVSEGMTHLASKEKSSTSIKMYGCYEIETMQKVLNMAIAGCQSQKPNGAPCFQTSTCVGILNNTKFTPTPVAKNLDTLNSFLFPLYGRYHNAVSTPVKHSKYDVWQNAFGYSAYGRCILRCPKHTECDVVIIRDHYGRKEPDTGWEVCHKISIHNGGTNAINNLLPGPMTCNRSIGKSNCMDGSS